MTEDEDEEATPVEVKKSTGSLPQMVRCPGCLGKRDDCDICEGRKFTNSKLVLETWNMRKVMQDSAPPTERNDK